MNSLYWLHSFYVNFHQIIYLKWVNLHFKYTNNKPYLNGNKKNDMINVRIVKMQKRH